jgi:hypothetical protein
MYKINATTTPDTPTIIHVVPFTPPHEYTADGRVAPEGSDRLTERDEQARPSRLRLAMGDDRADAGEQPERVEARSAPD